MTFEVGTVVIDTCRDRVGTVMDEIGSRIHIRPLGGGREWDVKSEYVRRASDLECRAAQARLLTRAVPIPRR